MGGNGFDFRFGGGIGGEGGRLSKIIQAMQMDQSPIYTSHVFGVGGR